MAIRVPRPRRGLGHAFSVSRQNLPELFCHSLPPWKPKGAGKAGRRRHPGSVRYEDAHGVDHRLAERPAFPARMVLTVSFVLSSGSDALLPPSPCG
jgi:hypothetical protein